MPGRGPRRSSAPHYEYPRIHQLLAKELERKLAEMKDRLCPTRATRRAQSRAAGSGSTRWEMPSGGGGAEADPKESPYVVLGLEPGASLAEAQRQYRKLALRYHPDKNPGDPAAEREFLKIKGAFDELKEQLAPSPASSQSSASPAASHEEQEDLRKAEREFAERFARRLSEDAKLYKTAFKKAKSSRARKKARNIDAQYAEFEDSGHPIAVALKAKAYTKMVELINGSRLYLAEDLGRGSTVFHFAAWWDDRVAFDTIMQLAGDSWWTYLTHTNANDDGDRPVDVARYKGTNILEHIEELTTQAESKGDEEKKDVQRAMPWDTIMKFLTAAVMIWAMPRWVCFRTALATCMALVARTLGCWDAACGFVVVAVAILKIDFTVMFWTGVLSVGGCIAAYVVAEFYHNPEALIALLNLWELQDCFCRGVQSWINPFYFWASIAFCLVVVELVPATGDVQSNSTDQLSKMRAEGGVREPDACPKCDPRPLGMRSEPYYVQGSSHSTTGAETQAHPCHNLSPCDLPVWVALEPEQCPQCDPRSERKRWKALKVRGEVQCFMSRSSVIDGLPVDDNECEKERLARPKRKVRDCSSVPPCESLEWKVQEAEECPKCDPRPLQERTSPIVLRARALCFRGETPVESSECELGKLTLPDLPEQVTVCKEVLPCDPCLGVACGMGSCVPVSDGDWSCVCDVGPPVLRGACPDRSYKWQWAGMPGGHLRCPTECDSPPTILRASPVCVDEVSGDHEPDGAYCPGKMPDGVVISCPTTSACARCPSGDCSGEDYEWRRLVSCPSDCGVGPTSHSQDCVRAWDEAVVHDKFCGGELEEGHGQARPTYSCPPTEPCDPCADVSCWNGHCSQGVCVCDGAHLGPYCLLPARWACAGEAVIIIILASMVLLSRLEKRISSKPKPKPKERRLEEVGVQTQTCELQRQPAPGQDCVVCLERPQTHAAIPCGHRAFCRDCARKLNKICPICRTTPVKTFQIFDDGDAE